MSTTKIYKQLYTHWPKLAIITLLYFPQKHFQTKNNRSQIFFVPMPVPILLLFSWRQRHPTPVLLPGKSRGRRSLVGCSPWGYEESNTNERLHFHALEKEMATHSSVLAWRIPGTGEPGVLPYMGLHRVGHDWSDLAAAATICQVATSNQNTESLNLLLKEYGGSGC